MSGVSWTSEELDEWSGGDPDVARELVDMTADVDVDCTGQWEEDGVQYPCERRFGHDGPCAPEWTPHY